tara:strand:- start:1278 stop:2615 length:1338 start_codon:yes stop_codon:yes gene_type:complete
MLKNRCLISLALLSLIQSCGGGGGSSSPKVPEVPVEYTFNLSSVLSNECGGSSSFSDVELLVQDDNWQTVSSHTADINGKISFVTLSKTINYTLIAKNQEGDEVEGLNVISYTQASTTTPAMYNARYDSRVDNTTCECITQDVLLSHRTFNERTNVNASAAFERWDAVDDQTTHFINVEACRTMDEAWPLHSFSVVGTDINGNAIGVAQFLSTFNANAQLEWSLSAVEVADKVLLLANHQAFESTQIIQSASHFALSVSENDNAVVLFDSHPYINESVYQSNARFIFQETSSIFGSTKIESFQQIISTNYDESFSVKASKITPNIDTVNFSEINPDGSYDFSNVSGYPMAIIIMTYQAFNPTTGLPMPAKWTTFGPVQGQLPINAVLTGYEDIINANTDKKGTDVTLIKSQATSSYADYLRYYQNGDLSTFANNLQRYHIEITLN